MNHRFLWIVLLITAPLNAGVWDSDRPDPLPSAYDAIGGRFDEFPQEFYEERLDLCRPYIDELASLEGNAAPSQVEMITESLPYFDDASVAHFRAGRYADAIILLDRKSRLISMILKDRTATAKEHRQRALANKAACLHHRWRGAANPEMSDLRLAGELLRALKQEDEYNADAHWSLIEVDWLLEVPAYKPGADPLFPNLLGLKDESFRGTLDNSAIVRNGLAGCIPWLTRRIVHEDGWRDVDVMYAYSLALFLAGRPEESLFAWFRVTELIDEGFTTRVSNTPGPDALKRILGVHLEDVPEQDAGFRLYRELREQCELWRKSRTDYLLSQLKQGRHPDTHRDFWAGWSLRDKGTPEPGRPEPDPGVKVSPFLLLGGFGGLILVLVLIFGAAVFMSRKGPAPSVDEL